MSVYIYIYISVKAALVIERPADLLDNWTVLMLGKWTVDTWA